MSCSCNGYCNNQDCGAYIAPCANSYPSYSSVTAGVTIHNAHWNQLRDSINGAYAHYGLGAPSWPTVAAGYTIGKVYYENYAKVYLNNLSQAYFTYNIVTTVFATGGLITAAGTVEIQNDSNTMRNACYCNYNCTCNINCTCNVNCVCDYP